MVIKIEFWRIDQAFIKKEGMYSFGPSTLCTKCPLQFFLKKTVKKEITPETIEIFDSGNDHHDREVRLNDGAKCIIHAEEHMKIKHKSGKFIISGKADHIKFDFDGRYIEDYKTCKYDSLKYFLENDIPLEYIWQTSLYAFIYYIHTGIVITRGIITKIDKENPRNRASRCFDLKTIAETEEFIVKHPVIQYFMDKNLNKTIDTILEATKLVYHTLDCNVCDYPNECVAIINFKAEV
jgi:hypothetical protein